MAVHRFFHEHGFFWVHTPIITASDAEGAGQMFRVSTLDFANLPRTPEGKIDFGKDFFGKEAHLTVSGQLNVEAYCLALSKVYTFGPTFRAENSNTTPPPRRVLDDRAGDRVRRPQRRRRPRRGLPQVHLQGACSTSAKTTWRSSRSAIDKERDRRALRDASSTRSFERIDYTEAIKRSSKKAGQKFEFPVKWGMDLQTEHERYLTEEHVGRPVVVMNYPKDIKAFYMRLNDDGKTVAAMDVLAPGIGEIIGGSQREERLDVLDARIDEMGLDPKHYGWYRDLRRYGTVPHAGFGLGFERLISTPPAWRTSAT